MDEKEAKLKGRELALAERDMALKEREAESKVELEKRRVVFASPLLIAIVSTFFGTAIGAGLQAYSTFNAEKNRSEASLQLERMKFEFSLVQRAFEEPDRDEAANQLLFLANSGVIRDLDVEQLKSLAKRPADLPQFTRLPAVEAELSTLPASGTIVGSNSGAKNVRVQPGTDSPVVYTVNPGERVTVLSRGSDSAGYQWLRISFDENEKEGWIAGQLVQVDRLTNESR